MSSLGQELGFSNDTVQRIIGDSLNVHLLTVFTYGLYTIIFTITIRHIVARGQWHIQRVALTVVVCLIWALTTISCGLVWNEAYVTFVTHGQTQDSILRFIFDVGPDADHWTSKWLAMSLVARLAIILNAMLAELTNIWRCWVIWDRRWSVIALPLLGVLSGLLSAALFLANLFPSGKMNVQVTPSQINWTIAYYSVTVAVNISTTSLIIFRILSIRGLKPIRTYRGIIEVLVESAFLYSATYIVFLATFVSDRNAPVVPNSFHNSNWYMTGVISAITAAAPTLIIGRAMAGETRPRDPPGLTSPLSIVDDIRFASIPPRRNTVTTVQPPGVSPHTAGQHSVPSILADVTPKLVNRPSIPEIDTEAYTDDKSRWRS